MEHIILTTDEQSGVAELTINRPKALNALNLTVLEELEQAAQKVAADTAVKVLIVTGSGDKAFVAGADIRQMQTMDSCQGHQFARRGQQVLGRLSALDKPVIAAVNGFALGGGLELALACDFIYAAATARLGFPEVGLGIIPGFGGTQKLARLIGVARARELVFSAAMINAEQALAWGIVNKVCPADELLPAVRQLAGRIAANSSLAVGYAKDAINNGLEMDSDNGLRYEAALFGVLFSSADQKEGMSAFGEKRQACFSGR